MYLSRMSNSNPANTPLPSGARLVKATTDILTDQKEYQRMVGGLMYTMLATRPDLAPCIQQISHCHNDPQDPTRKRQSMHWNLSTEQLIKESHLTETWD